ncbi:MAG: hypothetical protein Q9M43_06765 [Sulfurimonas sp.]|nr:hypothetical protein [Sulfurimonas sp.]
MKKLYKASSVKSLNIPTEYSTEYLQELFLIWYQYKHGKTSYAIAKDIILFNPKITQYDKTQINNKIIAIQELIR